MAGLSFWSVSFVVSVTAFFIPSEFFSSTCSRSLGGAGHWHLPFNPFTWSSFLCQLWSSVGWPISTDRDYHLSAVRHWSARESFCSALFKVRYNFSRFTPWHPWDPALSGPCPWEPFSTGLLKGEGWLWGFPSAGSDSVMHYLPWAAFWYQTLAGEPHTRFLAQ